MIKKAAFTNYTIFYLQKFMFGKKAGKTGYFTSFYLF